MASLLLILKTARLFPFCKIQAYYSLDNLALAYLDLTIRYSFAFAFLVNRYLTTPLGASAFMGRRSGQAVSPTICLRITAFWIGRTVKRHFPSAEKQLKSDSNDGKIRSVSVCARLKSLTQIGLQELLTPPTHSILLYLVSSINLFKYHWAFLKSSAGEPLYLCR